MVIEERNFYKKEIIMPNWLKATLACGLVCLFIPPLLGLFIGAAVVSDVWISGIKIDWDSFILIIATSLAELNFSNCATYSDPLWHWTLILTPLSVQPLITCSFVTIRFDEIKTPDPDPKTLLFCSNIIFTEAFSNWSIDGNSGSKVGFSIGASIFFSVLVYTC